MISVYVDNIFQVYESNGNVHIICGESTGETDGQGRDIYEKNMKIIVPLQKAQSIFSGLLEAVDSNKNTGISAVSAISNKENAGETLGAPLVFKI